MEAKVILALDFDRIDDVWYLRDQLGEADQHLAYLKVGHQLELAVGLKVAIRELATWRKPIFVDRKLTDIDATMSEALRLIKSYGAAAVSVMKLSPPCPRLKRWLVVELSDNVFDSDAFRSLEWAYTMADETVHCDGLIIPGALLSRATTSIVRDSRHRRNFPVIASGIRPAWFKDERHTSSVTPAAALDAGANFVVIGRPITKPPAKVGTPRDALLRLAEEIETVTASC